MNNQQTIDEDEIDIGALLYEIKRYIWIILLCGVLGGGIAFAYSKFMITPIFTAENSMLVLTKETTLTSLADLQLGSQLTNDYMELIVSRPVLDELMSNLDLYDEFETIEELAGTITITNPSNTRILELQVENPDPEKALAIVRELSDISSEYIGDMMEVIPPKIIDEGVVPTRKTSPSNTKNALIGIFAGLFISGGIVVLRSILDDTIKSEEDIEKYLNLSTLSIVPDRKDHIDRKNKKTEKSTKRKGGAN